MVANSAGEPSPVDDAAPDPATVVIVVPVTWRMRLLVVSAIRTAPPAVTLMPLGPLRVASDAAGPSPLKAAGPGPAEVVVTPGRPATNPVGVLPVAGMEEGAPSGGAPAA